MEIALALFHPELALLSPFFFCAHSEVPHERTYGSRRRHHHGILPQTRSRKSSMYEHTRWKLHHHHHPHMWENCKILFIFSMEAKLRIEKKFTDGSASSSPVSRDNSFLPPRVYYVDGSTTVRNLSSAELLWIQRSHDQHRQPVRSIFTMFQIVHCRCSRSQSVISCWVISPLYRSIILWNGASGERDCFIPFDILSWLTRRLTSARWMVELAATARSERKKSLK